MKKERYVKITRTTALDLLQLVSKTLDQFEDAGPYSLDDDEYLNLRMLEIKLSKLVDLPPY